MLTFVSQLLVFLEYVFIYIWIYFKTHWTEIILWPIFMFLFLHPGFLAR